MDRPPAPAEQEEITSCLGILYHSTVMQARGQPPRCFGIKGRQQVKRPPFLSKMLADLGACGATRRSGDGPRGREYLRASTGDADAHSTLESGVSHTFFCLGLSRSARSLEQCGSRGPARGRLVLTNGTADHRKGIAPSCTGVVVSSKSRVDPEAVQALLHGEPQLASRPGVSSCPARGPSRDHSRPPISPPASALDVAAGMARSWWAAAQRGAVLSSSVLSALAEPSTLASRTTAGVHTMAGTVRDGMLVSARAASSLSRRLRGAADGEAGGDASS